MYKRIFSRVHSGPVVGSSLCLSLLFLLGSVLPLSSQELGADALADQAPQKSLLESPSVPVRPNGTDTRSTQDSVQDLRPGLGIEGFSPNDLEQQLNSVRQFSATPLQLEPSSKNSLEDAAMAPVNENATQTPPDAEPQVTQTAAPTNQSQSVPDDAKFRPLGRSALPSPMPKTTANRSIPSAPNAEDSSATASPTTSKTKTPSVAAATTAKKNTSLPSKQANKLPQNESDSSISQLGTRNKQTNISKTIPLGDPFQISLHGLIWTYIPGFSEYPREPEFERELGNLETSFRFSFPTVGRYFLTFSRQFPSTGELEYYNAEIIVKGSQTPVVDDSSNYQPQKFIAQPIDNINSPPEQSIKLSDTSSKNISDLNNNINYHITSQVISDIRKQLKDGELDSAYQTLNSWPAGERGDIYDTAAQRFLAAGMTSEAVDMWQRNMALEGDLRGKALTGIIDALTQAQDPKKLLKWLPQFLEEATKKHDPPETPLINSEDFAKVYHTLNQLNRDSDQNAIVSLDSKDAAHVLEFYQTYVNFYPDNNSPEILYNMGLFLEQPGENQDIRRSRQLYKSIQTNYPVDKYNQKAFDRLNYLDRQLFIVR